MKKKIKCRLALESNPSIDYRMLIANVYKEIVQCPQNLTKRSHVHIKKRGILVDVILIMNQDLENSF